MKRLLAVLVLLVLAVSLAGCAQPPAPSQGGAAAPSPKPEPVGQQEKEDHESWVVYINDDDSYSQGGITYSIALNLTATNPTSEVAGKYTGSATARTTTQGDVGGAQLNAEAIANSSQLEFALEDPSKPDPLAPLTLEQTAYKGTGSITMKAAGTASVGPASGGFSNNSSQRIDVQTKGSKVTLSVVIQGHKYTFNGTLSGK